MKEMKYVMHEMILDTFSQEGESCQCVRWIFKTRRIFMHLNPHN